MQLLGLLCQVKLPDLHPLLQKADCGGKEDGQ